MDAARLLSEALVIDTHNDTIVAHIRRGNYSLFADGEAARQGAEARHAGTISFLRGSEAPRPGANPIQINVPKMRRAGIDCGFFAIDVTLAFKNWLTYALDGLGYLLHDLQNSGAEAVIVRRAQDVLEAKAAGRPALLLAVEHADVVERSLNVLRALYELGVRSIGLTHNLSSWAADGNAEARDGVGLTRFGRELVREMNRLGMVVDLAHVSQSAFFSALEIAEKPVIFSHGNCRALCDHPRNLTDDQLRALRDNGGVIGLSFVPMFVDREEPTLERFFDHVDHVVEVAGIETVGLGSDFDGGGTLLPDATHLPRIVEGLARRGYAEHELRHLLGENTMRVLRQAMG
ncbi:MAG: membrane dipeptidase [Chloroflexi bacterium]|nr:membrane dipeptidase [Chloroflexota bacterium]